MPKIRETKEAYIVEPSFMESLGPALNQIAEAYVKKQLLDQKRKQDQEEAELEQAKWELQLAELSKTDPEKATELQNLPAVARILDPKRIERMKHENESLFTKFRHRKEHEALKATPIPKGTELGFPLLAAPSLLAPGQRPDYKVSPQLKAAREKAEDEARKASTEADLAENKTGAILAGVSGGNVASQMVLQGLDPGNPTAVMAFLKKHKEIETKYESEVPGTESFISKKAADLSGDLLKEYPGGNAKDLQAFARSVYTGENLPADVRKRLGESVATKKLKLDERAQRAREAEVVLSRQRLDFEKNKTAFETTQYLVNNGVDSADAPAMAASIIATGKAPEGMNIPQDLLKKAQQDKFNDDHLDAQIRSPKFQALSALAQRSPEGPQRNAYIRDMQKEFCKVAGPSTASCGYSADPGVWEGALKVYKANLDLALKAMSKTYAVGAGTAGIARDIATADPLQKTPPSLVAPGTPMTQEEIGEHVAMTPEKEAVSKRYLDFARPLLANPSTPPALRNKLTEDAKALHDALLRGDLAEIGRIMGGVRQ